jgi:predicted methyltransferase
VPIALFALAGCGGLSKVDYTTFGRGGWQRPDDVVAALALRPGDRVADLGAGEGYFIPHLSQAVGIDGRVYATPNRPRSSQRSSQTATSRPCWRRKTTPGFRSTRSTSF